MKVRIFYENCRTKITNVCIFKSNRTVTESGADFIKYPCFLCEWDSRARSEHWEREQWPPRIKKNILRVNL